MYSPGQRIISISEDSKGNTGTIEKFSSSHQFMNKKWNTYYVRWDNGKLGVIDDFDFIPDINLSFNTK